MEAAFARDVQSGSRVMVGATLSSLTGLTERAYDREYGAAAIRREEAQAKKALAASDQMAPDGGSGGSYAYIDGYDISNVVLQNYDNDDATLAIYLDGTSGARGSVGGIAAERITDLVTISLRASR